MTNKITKTIPNVRTPEPITLENPSMKFRSTIMKLQNALTNAANVPLIRATRNRSRFDFKAVPFLFNSFPDHLYETHEIQEKKI